MPNPTTSPSISTSKPKAKAKAGRAALAAVLAASALLLLGGCMAVDESSLYMDEPLGADYLPVVTRTVELWPGRVLVLPVAGHVDDEARNLFESKFLPTLKDKMRWILIPYPGIDSTHADVLITEAQAIAKAQEVNADAILFVKLSQEQIYPPLRIVADVYIQDVATKQTVLSMHADFDGGAAPVGESARRYAKKYLPKTDSPEKSREILGNLREYLGFTGYYSAKLVSDAFLVPAKQAQKAQAVDGQYSGGFATPPPDLGKPSGDPGRPIPPPTPAPAPPSPPAPTAAADPKDVAPPQTTPRPGPGM